MMKAMMDENIRLAKTKKDLEKYNAYKNMVGDKYDLTSAENDPFLNEHFTTTTNSLGDHRYKPYHFKGLKDEHVAKVVREREMQLKEAELKKQQEKEERRLWSIQEEHLRRLKIKQDRLLKKNNRAMQEAALAHQLDQNKENKIRWKDPYGDRS